MYDNHGPLEKESEMRSLRPVCTRFERIESNDIRKQLGTADTGNNSMVQTMMEVLCWINTTREARWQTENKMKSEQATKPN